ncbi:uncharacterized protein TM_0508-like [Mercenaria mercenaria]|uniref:uncharacterized protein TM_0508-like n=1 Tax=Mercenaria mercenaria TaxID=6596 RepID=UPI00234F514B|nr:uncharacterized protein TM_0508-like [Mercenaria mercenaria]
MLDPDMFKDIKQVQANVQNRGIASIISSNEPRSAKSKVPSKPKFRLSPSKMNNDTSKMKDSLRSNAAHESSGTTKSDPYANVVMASETELRLMRNDKAAFSEEPHAPVLELISANRNDETPLNEKIHESEPEVYNSKIMQRYAVCEMTCGRRITVMKGSLVNLRVDVMEGSIDEGEAFVSEAGSLPAKHVVHVNSPIKREGTENEHRLLGQTVRNAMMQASVKNAKTIALPAISCGTSGFTSKKATGLIVRAVRNFFREDQSSSLEHVYLVDITPQTAKRFQEALCREFKDDTKCVVEVMKES